MPAAGPSHHRHSRAAHRRRWRRRRTAVGLFFVAALAMLAGMTDAIGFLSAGDFVSFMSGNTTQLAIAVGQGRYVHAGFLGLLILLYVLGNALGIVALRLFRQRQAPLLLLVGALLAAGGLAPGPAAFLPAIAVTVLSMGLVNAAVERVEGHPFGVTYVTGALSRFGRGLGRFFIGDRSSTWLLEAVPFGGMLFGAIVGAVAEGAAGRLALLLPCGLALGLAVSMALIPRRWRLAYQMPHQSSVKLV